MKLFYFVLLLLAISCSSHKKSDSISANKVTNETFKKEKALKPSEVADYYPASAKSLSPALQDETMDRLTADEKEKVEAGTDVLLELTLLCSKGEFDKGFSLAGKSFNRYQKIPAYWNLIANCHLNQGNSRKALLFYNKALEINPSYVPALNNIGVLYSRQGHEQKALIAFERANKQSKFSKTPRYNLAKLYLSFGLAEPALPLFQSLLNDSPSDVDLLNAIASSQFLLSNYQGAFAHYERIPKSEWQRAEIGLNLSLTLQKLGKMDEAIKVFSEIESPKASELKRYYALVEKQLGERK